MLEILLRSLGVDTTGLAANLPLRAGLAALCAFALCALGTRALLALLLRLRVAEAVEKTDSEKLAELHKEKAHTPTMGGISMVAGLAVATLFFAAPLNEYVLVGLLLTGAFALLGFLDDWIKLTRPGAKGLSIKAKLAWQTLLAAGAAVFLHGQGADTAGLVDLYVPFLPGVHPALPPALFVGFAALVLVTTVNAVNFTDGLDGLASGCSAISAAAFAVFAGLAGSATLAPAFGLPFVDGASELAVFAAALAGTGLGFLWHNGFPARLFMGDTGSLALGGALGYTALALKLELLLPLVGAVFVAEGASVLLQVLSFRLTGRRLFLIAPLHHRYQFLGWPETRITLRFWISAVVGATAGVIAVHG